MVAQSSVVSSSTFLRLWISTLRLMTSSLSLLLSDSTSDNFSLNTLTLCTVACDSVAEAMATVARSSSILSNRILSY